MTQQKLNHLIFILILVESELNNMNNIKHKKGLPQNQEEPILPPNEEPTFPPKEDPTIPSPSEEPLILPPDLPYTPIQENPQPLPQEFPLSPEQFPDKSY